MELTRIDKENKSLIKINGRLTATRLSESLRGMVKTILADNITTIILDMNEVLHMDSTGVGELVSAYTAVRKENGTLYLTGLSEIIHELLNTTNLLDIFQILPENASELSDFK
jgi:anti-sigma B factor antagonist